MKKLVVLFLVSILMLIGCSSDSNNGNNAKEGNNGNTGNTEKTEKADSTGDSEKITVWAWDPNFNIAALDIAKEAYKNVNADLEIEVIESAQDDIVQRLNTALSSGVTDGLPNIALIEDYRAQGFLQAFPDAFYEISDVFDEGDFAEYKIAPTSVDGKNYGLPFDSGVTGLYVRTDYLAEAGYSVEDMQDIDWWEYIEIGKAVKEATGKYFLSIDPSDLGFVRIMLQSAGTWYTTDDGVTPNLAGNEGLKESLELYKAMLDANIVQPNSDWSQFIASFNSGEVATVPTGNWITPSVKAEESQSGDWAVVPVPKMTTSGATHASNLGGSSWYVFDLPGAEQAADFLGKTFGSDSDFYQQLLTEVGAIGTYSPAADGEAYATEEEFFQGQKIFADFAEWMEDVPSINYGLHTYAIHDIIVVETQNYLNGKDIDDVLNDAQTQAESQLR